MRSALDPWLGSTATDVNRLFLMHKVRFSSHFLDCISGAFKTPSRGNGVNRGYSSAKQDAIFPHCVQDSRSWLSQLELSSHSLS